MGRGAGVPAGTADTPEQGRVPGSFPAEVSMGKRWEQGRYPKPLIAGSNDAPHSGTRRQAQQPSRNQGRKSALGFGSQSCH